VSRKPLIMSCCIKWISAEAAGYNFLDSAEAARALTRLSISTLLNIVCKLTRPRLAHEVIVINKGNVLSVPRQLLSELINN